MAMGRLIDPEIFSHSLGQQDGQDITARVIAGRLDLKVESKCSTWTCIALPNAARCACERCRVDFQYCLYNLPYRVYQSGAL
jgi:hypothetical protein